MDYLKKKLTPRTSTSKFKGQGHALGGEGADSRVAASNARGTSAVKTAQEKVKRKIQGDDNYRPPADAISDAEKDARRQRQTAAAEQRSKQWGNKVSGARKNRAEEDKRTQYSPANDLPLGTTASAFPEGFVPGPAPPAVDFGTFNPYEAQFSSSTQARVAMNTVAQPPMTGQPQQQQLLPANPMMPAPGAVAAPAPMPTLPTPVSGGGGPMVTCPVCGGDVEAGDAAEIHVERCLLESEASVSTALERSLNIAGPDDDVTDDSAVNNGGIPAAAAAAGATTSPAQQQQHEQQQQQMMLALASALTVLSSSSSTGVGRCAATLHKLLSNVRREPMVEKYRQVRLGNATFQERVGSVEGGLSVLRAVGFVEEPGEEGERFLRLAERVAVAACDSGVLDDALVRLKALEAAC